MPIFTFILPQDIDPTLAKIIDGVIIAHMIAFVAAVLFFLQDIIKDPKVIFAQKQQTMQDRVDFLNKLEKLKERED